MNRTAILLLLLSVFAFAQEQKPAPPPISPAARLNAAKTAYVTNKAESDVPYNVIQGGLEGWPRFILVDAPDKADVVIEISAQEDDSGVSVSSSSDAGGNRKKIDHDLSITLVKLTVYDANTHLYLWTASERPKGGFKDKTREDNLVKASEALLQKFRDRMEPLPSDSAAANPK